MNTKHGFTLLELLVVMAIIAIIVAFAIANFVGARSRARDIRKKAELLQMQSALRLYYNDYNTYPPSGGGALANDLTACGSGAPAPNASCAETCNGQFAVGGGGCATVYMKLLPPASDYGWSYEQVAGGDNFCLWTTLDNSSDTEITKSQGKCASVTTPPGPCFGVVPSTAYVVCAD